MSIPPRYLDELRDRLTLSEVIGRRIKVARAGREFKACCPFHHEKTPSFYINDDKQFYHCFGCGAHGDVIGFVMQNDHLSFIETVKMLSAEAGMQMPEQSPQDVERAEREKSLHSLVDETARFFADKLHDRRYPEALQYLADRGVPPTLIDAFRLGYAPPDGQALIHHLKDKGYTLEQMVEAGVARRSDRNGEAYSFFRDRVMFTVADRRGRAVAFGGRVLPEHLRPLPPGADKPPKYINSSETSLFRKGHMLYGEAHARQAAMDGQALIVVEGYLDVIACFGAGFRGAVAPLGTALTPDQIGVLWKTIPGDEKIPVLCFDGDDAGRRAAARACANLLPLLKPNHSARIAFLPQGQDPDSLIRAQGAKAFAAIIDSAMNLADFVWTHHTDGRVFATPEAKAGLEAALAAEAAVIPDRAVQQYYKQVFRDRIFKAFRTPFGVKGRGGKAPPPAVPVLPSRRPAGDPAGLAARILLTTMINHPHIFDMAEKDFAELAFTDRRLDLLRQAVHEALAADSTLDSAGLQSHLKERGFEADLQLALNENVYTHAGFARPGCPQEKIMLGWSDTVRHMHKRTLGNELRQAGQVFASEFTEENERRLIGLSHAVTIEQE